MIALGKLVSAIKKQIAIIVAEVVAKSFLDHIYYEGESNRTNGQNYLSANARTRSIAKAATSSVNKCCFSESDKTTINFEEVSLEVIDRLKPSFAQNQNAGPSTST